MPIFAIEQYSSLPLLVLNDDCVPYVGIIEVEPIVNFKLPLEFIFYFICIPVLFCGFKFVIFVTRLKTFNFDVLDALRLILGMPLLSFPKTFIKRVIVFLIFFITMIFSIGFIASISRNLISYDEITFNSFNEISKSDYKLAMNRVVQKSVFNSEKDYSINILKEKLVNQDIICPDARMKKVICVLSMFRAKSIIEKSTQNATKIYKMISVRFGCNAAAYPFERASPFINQFKLIFLRMYEAGIYNNLKDGEKGRNYDDRVQKEIVNEFLLVNLIIIITFGYMISIVVFIIEITLYHLR